jgi:hypothetical protein
LFYSDKRQLTRRKETSIIQENENRQGSEGEWESQCHQQKVMETVTASWRKGMTKPSLPGHSDRIGGRENMVMIRDHLPYFRRKLPQVFREECRDEGI